MFRINAFGQRITCNPRLVSVKDKDDTGGGDDGTVELDGEKFTFPKETAVADMTPAQAAEYWRHESKKQQKRKAEPPADYVEAKAKADLYDREQAEKLPEQERKLAEAAEAARLEGEVIGAERYLKDAVFGRVQGITGLEDDALSDHLAAIDPKYFVDAEGNLDAEKIKKFAEPLVAGGPGAGASPDPVRDAIRRQQAAGGGGGQSMSDRRKATAERLSKKKTPTT